MPKTWCYFIALLLPLAVQVVIFYTGFVDWLWYNDHIDSYNFFNRLRVQPQFLEFIGGWQLIFFTGLMFFYWIGDYDEETIPRQFLLLPIIYLPFTIVGDTMRHASFDVSTLFIHPFVVIPAGYVYIMLWGMFVWVMNKFKLVM